VYTATCVWKTLQREITKTVLLVTINYRCDDGSFPAFGRCVTNNCCIYPAFLSSSKCLNGHIQFLYKKPEELIFDCAHWWGSWYLFL
jgi:hypothetical protein